MMTMLLLGINVHRSNLEFVKAGTVCARV